MAALAQLVELLVVVQAVAGSSPAGRPNGTANARASALLYSPHMAKFIDEFKAFALRGNALDLAIGVVIGAAFNGIVNSLVADIITPPLSLLTGGIDFKTLAFPIEGTDAVIHYGLFLQNVISFIITAFALFLLVRLIHRFVHETPPPAAAKPADLIVLEEIRDALKARA